ncbi:hypothetical protein PFISCL1PPCAC_2379, partial [Pristionchus fissidentatus]
RSFTLYSAMSISHTLTDRTPHNALPLAHHHNLSPKYFIPFEAIDRSTKLREVSLTVSKRDENPIASSFNARYKVTWVGESSHFEEEFRRVETQLLNVLKEGKKPMECNYADSTAETDATTTQPTHVYGELLVILKLHYKKGGQLALDRYKRRFSVYSRVEEVIKWVESLKATFESCKDPVVIYELRGGAVSERVLRKLDPTATLGSVAGKSTILPIVVDRANAYN